MRYEIKYLTEFYPELKQNDCNPMVEAYLPEPMVSMGEKTGTLWEHRQYKGSQDHGFASYALVVIQNALKR